jgi:protein required for attachment to host cells
MLLPHGIMVALVDGERFEFYRNIGTETEPRMEALPTPDLAPHNKGAGVRHQVSPANPSRNLLDEDAHAAAVAGWLNQKSLNHSIERLVIAAAPRTLGELRRHYHVTLEGVLAAELDKNLIGRPPDAIIAALREKP